MALKLGSKEGRKKWRQVINNNAGKVLRWKLKRNEFSGYWITRGRGGENGTERLEMVARGGVGLVFEALAREVLEITGNRIHQLKSGMIS
ncbi:hypothetical protein CEXT_799921 [Caerostris extrusa]|uniref:Uncharacterized protein n=1 Tax=Caerostris extrusa TaxID=172846 RepID=A0AAV4QD07_CAEEX|nr:hypothetical protein CEXT_799921 [Caerostris extrusa]